MEKLKLLVLFSISLLLLFPACSSRKESAEVRKSDFVVKDFDPLTNWDADSTGTGKAGNSNLKGLSLDYSGARENGFVIPSVNQTADGKFHFVFSLKNTGNKPSKFFYKIFYQNESYKFPETGETDSLRQHIHADENFYGSWEDVNKTFPETEIFQPDDKFHEITGDFRIVGNPRDEKLYYSDKNDRWKRNPRVGKYSFLLVVTTEENLKKIPGEVKNISLQKDGIFVNPYYYFLFGPGKSLNATVTLKAAVQLAVAAHPDPGAGINIPSPRFDKQKDGKYFCKTCGISEEFEKNAHFEQFINYVDASTRWENIPVIADLMGDEYSLTDYNWNRQFYKREEMIGVVAATAKFPCQTVKSDPEKHTITLINPAAEFGRWEKQSVGIITRHGFAYGKWTIKAKLTELLNKNGMWNGLTNAVWLITQSQDPWNFRRGCSKQGYMATYWGGANDQRVEKVGYSEIDFEILKTVPYCPSYLLPPAYNNGYADQTDARNWNIPFPEEVAGNPSEIQVACTNWDMACWEPENFNDGCNQVQYGDQTFWAHRWDKNYRALTEKVPANDDELFGSEYFYFQIDWQPERIIWRIGPSKDKLRVVGYEDSKDTSIPNNQMLMIVTQEYHNTKWWVGSPYSQDNIPFPEKDLKGEIFELTVE